MINCKIDYRVFLVGRDNFGKGVVFYRGSEPFQIDPDVLGNKVKPDELAWEIAEKIAEGKSLSSGGFKAYRTLNVTREIPKKTKK